MSPRAICLALTLFSLSGCARTAGTFGFGPAPTVQEVRTAVNEYLTKDLYRPSSVLNLTIGRPVAGCMYRGIWKRNICGYRVCVSYNAQNQYGNYVGNKPYDFWITNGWGTHVMPSYGVCSKGFTDWNGEPRIAETKFCDVEPDHADCAKGRVETFQPAQVAEASPEKAPASQAQYTTLQAARWTPASAEELAQLSSEADRYLKDGVSARYMDVVIAPDKVAGVKKFCGLINAKNSWGAYGGYTRFIYSTVGFFAMEDKYNGRFISESCK